MDENKLSYSEIQSEYQKLFDSGVNTSYQITDLRFTYESFCARIDHVSPEKRKNNTLCINAKYHLIRILKNTLKI